MLLVSKRGYYVLRLDINFFVRVYIYFRLEIRFLR